MPDSAPDRTDPFNWFHAWMAEAVASEPNDPNAMTLATATQSGLPSARIVLLKEVDPPGAPARGFLFYTNHQSRKGDELGANAACALLFYWKTLHRQIRIEGRVTHVTDAEADAYYASRPRISRLGAWASLQSRPLPSRGHLERRLAEFETQFPGEAIPRPPYWSGYRVVPERFEFWQDMPFRLHDRTTFVREGGGWTSGKLYP
ncbi:MAG: pyridoxamine 5'-phosphate oxidase [Proteobacteria bacterium]|nr:pyridoxamine 5'-phosphate oxidase [Pseudomonadota bacterium]